VRGQERKREGETEGEVRLVSVPGHQNSSEGVDNKPPRLQSSTIASGTLREKFQLPRFPKFPAVVTRAFQSRSEAVRKKRALELFYPGTFKKRAIILHCLLVATLSRPEIFRKEVDRRCFLPYSSPPTSSSMALLPFCLRSFISSNRSSSKIAC